MAFNERPMFRFLSILALTVTTVRLFAAGLLTPGYVVIALLTGVALMAMGPRIRVAALAVGGLILFSRLASGGDAAAMTGLIGQLLAITIALAGIYMIIRKPLGGGRRT